MTEIDLEALSTSTHGYTVNDDDDDDPILLDRDGNHIETWRKRRSSGSWSISTLAVSRRRNGISSAT